MYTVKPLDKDTVIAAAKETKIILTCEEHQVGGFGDIIAGVISCPSGKGVRVNIF